MRKFNLKVLLLLSCGHMVVDLYQAALPAILPFIKENLGLSYTLAGVVLIVVFGVVLISTFSVTIVMGQNLFPHNLGVASGLLAGFAIGAGGIGVTLLGIIADHFGIPFAMKCIGCFPQSASL